MHRFVPTSKERSVSNNIKRRRHPVNSLGGNGVFSSFGGGEEEELLQSKAELLSQLTIEKKNRDERAAAASARTITAQLYVNVSADVASVYDATRSLPLSHSPSLQPSLSTERPAVHSNPLRSSHLWSKKSFDMFKRMQGYYAKRAMCGGEVGSTPVLTLPDYGLLLKYSKGDAIGVVDTFFPSPHRDSIEHCFNDWIFFKSRFEIAKVTYYVLL